TLGMIFDRLPPADGQHPFHDDLTKDVQIVQREHADAAVLAFCGVGQKLGAPLPVVHRWLGKLPAHVVYLPDFQNSFYINGIRSLGQDRPATLKALREIVRRLGARRIFCYGCSAGTLGALQYGVALEAEAVLCLAGSVNLSPEFNAHSAKTTRRLRNFALGG